VLYVFSGLPGTGKTSLARRLARHLGAVYLRIDTVEQALRDLCSLEVEGEGYRLAYRVAADNLRLGISVIADSCNPVELTRSEWESVAAANDARCVNIEITCSDVAVHRGRVESRSTTINGLPLPSWDDICRREYEPWQRDRVVIDTPGDTVDDSFEKLLSSVL
jgi:predicted kinase